MNVAGINRVNNVKSNQNFGQLVTIGRGAEVLEHNLGRCFPKVADGFRSQISAHANISEKVIFDGKTVTTAGFTRTTTNPLGVIAQALKIAAEKA